MKIFISRALLFGGTSLALLANAQHDDRAAHTILLDERGVRNLRIETQLVQTQDFETTVFAIGRIEEIPSRHSVLSTRVAGRVKRLNFFEGDFVENGEIVAEIETRQLGDPPPSISLRTPQAGLVTVSHIRLGQPVEPDAELMHISDRSVMWAVAKIPEQAATGVQVGSLAYIRIPALGETIIEGTLARFGVNADRDAGTVEGIFEIENVDGRLRPGLRAEFSIVLGARPDVLAVPREAVQGDPANRVVFATDSELEHAFIRTPVVLGERNDRYVEVLSGLAPGDEVVTRGSYSLMFAGRGQSVSLKEALDVAHGHAHNEDGSEIDDARPHDHDHDHEAHEDGHEDGHEAHEDGPLRWALMIYAALMTVLSVVLMQWILKAKRGDAA